MSSPYYNEFRADKRVRWNRDKTIKFMCPCVRPPRKEVCVDPIKGNAKFVARALRRVLLDKQKTAGAQDRHNEERIHLRRLDNVPTRRG